jgi:hypothetical protein
MYITMPKSGILATNQRRESPLGSVVERITSNDKVISSILIAGIFKRFFVALVCSMAFFCSGVQLCVVVAIVGIIYMGRAGRPENNIINFARKSICLIQAVDMSLLLLMTLTPRIEAGKLPCVPEAISTFAVNGERSLATWSNRIRLVHRERHLLSVHGTKVPQ